MRSIVVCLAIAASLSACDFSPHSSALYTLSRREAQWNNQGLHSYTYLYSYTWINTKQARITVEADTVSLVVDPETNAVIGPSTDRQWPTIGSLFAMAKDFLEDKHVDVNVKFDAQLSYPTLIYAQDPSTPSGPSTTRASSLVPLR